MKKISTAELKKAIVAVETERLKHPATFRPDRAQRAALQKSRKALEKIVSGFLKKAGLDKKNFQALQEQRGVKLERMIAKHKTDALRLASRQKDTLFSSIAAQSKTCSRFSPPTTAPALSPSPPRPGAACSTASERRPATLSPQRRTATASYFRTPRWTCA